MRRYVEFEGQSTRALASEWTQVESAILEIEELDYCPDTAYHYLDDLKERLQCELRWAYLNMNNFKIDPDTDEGQQELFELHHSDELAGWIRRQAANNR